MKIDTSARARASFEDSRSFEEQLADAKASGRPFGTVTDVATGKRAVVVFTEEEAAHMEGYKVVRRKKPWRQELDDLKAELAALRAAK